MTRVTLSLSPTIAAHTPMPKPTERCECGDFFARPGHATCNRCRSAEEVQAEREQKVALKKQQSCPICMGVVQDPATLDGCTHSFCSGCILPWSEIKTNCPCCRAPITEITTETEKHLPPPKGLSDEELMDEELMDEELAAMEEFELEFAREATAALYDAVQESLS